MSRLSIGSVDSNDELFRALAAEGLPVEDIGDEGLQFFAFHCASQEVGFGGLEGDGPDRILRSVVIHDATRGRGTGREAVALLEGEARSQGAERLHLLTTTAADFFRKLGYRDCDRADAPPSVASAREFAALCPANADYLVKQL